MATSQKVMFGIFSRGVSIPNNLSHFLKIDKSECSPDCWCKKKKQEEEEEKPIEQ